MFYYVIGAIASCVAVAVAFAPEAYEWYQRTTPVSDWSPRVGLPDADVAFSPLTDQDLAPLLSEGYPLEVSRREGRILQVELSTETTSLKLTLAEHSPAATLEFEDSKVPSASYSEHFRNGWTESFSCFDDSSEPRAETWPEWRARVLQAFRDGAPMERRL